jgi:hypothetical protein
MSQILNTAYDYAPGSKLFTCEKTYDELQCYNLDDISFINNLLIVNTIDAIEIDDIVNLYKTINSVLIDMDNQDYIKMTCDSIYKIEFRNQELYNVLLPVSLRILIMGSTFNRKIQHVKWPKSLHTLNLGKSFNQEINYISWPTSLHTLILGRKFDRDINNVNWPMHLHTLMNLNDRVKVINRIIKESRSLSHFTFGYLFDRNINDISWNQLTHVTFGTRFNQDLKFGNNKIIYIKFGDCFNRDISTVLWPISLNTLIFGDNFNRSISSVLWPIELNTLTFGMNFNQDISSVNWSISLNTLTFGYNFNQDATNLPKSLYQITFDIMFNTSINCSAERIIFLGMFNRDISDMQCDNLTHLTFGLRFNQKLPSVMPKLTHLHLGVRYNQPLNDIYMPVLHDLHFGFAFNQDISQVNWPESLYQLTFGNGFNNIHMINARFKNLSIIEDYSCSITINSCKFPPSLWKIIYIHTYKFIYYIRNIGQYTKSAHL